MIKKDDEEEDDAIEVLEKEQFERLRNMEIEMEMILKITVWVPKMAVNKI